MPFFSVVIPLFNKENYIESTLKSVLSQNFTDFEVIIVNDGSTDKSLIKIEHIEDERIKIFNQKNQGVATARNYGISKASGKYIALIDADDLWKPNHLNNFILSIHSFPKASLYCNNYEILYTKSIEKPAQFNINLKNKPFLVEDFFKASTINCLAWTSAVCFPKATFKNLGGFKTSYETCEDLDFWIRAALHGDVIFNPDISMTYKMFVENSLMKNDNNLLRYNFINSYNKEEQTNKSLKLFLDINRYALAMRCKLSGESKIYKKALSEISPSNLNKKQLFLIKLPKQLISPLKSLQNFLIKKGLYFTAFK